MSVLFQSPAMTIGKHEWRIVVIPSRYSGNCTEYQFRRTGHQHWQDSNNWHGYNINDTYLGMPKSLLRLYRSHKAEIVAALDGQPVPQPSFL